MKRIGFEYQDDAPRATGFASRGGNNNNNGRGNNNNYNNNGNNYNNNGRGNINQFSMQLTTAHIFYVVAIVIGCITSELTRTRTLVYRVPSLTADQRRRPRLRQSA